MTTSLPTTNEKPTRLSENQSSVRKTEISALKEVLHSKKNKKAVRILSPPEGNIGLTKVENITRKFNRLNKELKQLSSLIYHQKGIGMISF